MLEEQVVLIVAAGDVKIDNPKYKARFGKKVLENVGDFSAELYFSLKNPSTFDAEKYFYKYRILDERYESGVVLYRNAFSISSYEGLA